MTTTDKPNYSQEAYLILKEAGGQEMTPSDVADIFEARGYAMKREVVSAIVAGLPKERRDVPAWSEWPKAPTPTAPT